MKAVGGACLLWPPNYSAHLILYTASIRVGRRGQSAIPDYQQMILMTSCLDREVMMMVDIGQVKHVAIGRWMEQWEPFLAPR